MSRPTVEVADIFRAQGKDFIDRHRKRMRFQQLKVMQAPSCDAAQLLLAVISTCACVAVRTGASPLTHAGIGIAPSVRLKHASVGSPPESGNCWPPATSTSCSVCRTN